MSASWTPPDNQQKVSVTVGSSMLRALNARKSGGAPRNAKPLRECYSFRYNFKPPSVDPDKRGRIIVGSNSNVTVERPSSQSSEAHKWTGQEVPAKEWDCILIYDENQKSFILEKLESGLALTHQPRTGANDTEMPAKHTKADADDDFEQELLDAAAVRPSVSAKGEDDYFDEIFPMDIREEEEEEEEGEVLPSPPPPPPHAKKQTRKSTTTPTTKLSAKAVKPTPAPTPAPAPPQASKPLLPPPPPSTAPLPTPNRVAMTALMPPPPSAPAAPTPKPQPKPVPPRGKRHKPESEAVPAPASAVALTAPQASTSTSTAHLSDADEEDLQFGKPTKRARPSQGPGLALPGASAAAFIPPPPPAPATAPSIAAPEPNEIGSESEDEGWDEVIGNPVDTKDDFDIFGEASGAADDAEGEDIGIDDLEMAINLQMTEAEDEEEEDEDDDFLAAVVDQAPPSHGRPMSLVELASGAAYVSDDEYSSSEESDDD